VTVHLFTLFFENYPVQNKVPVTIFHRGFGDANQWTEDNKIFRKVA